VAEQSSEKTSGRTIERKNEWANNRTKKRVGEISNEQRVGE